MSQDLLSLKLGASTDKVLAPRNRKAERNLPAARDTLLAHADEFVNEVTRTEIMDVVDVVICVPPLPDDPQGKNREWRIPAGVIAAEKVFRELPKDFRLQHKRQWACCSQEGNVSVHPTCKAGFRHALQQGFPKDTFIVRPVSEVGG